METMGKYKGVTVLDSIQRNDVELAEKLELKIGKAELQKLFISLTN
jgi:hypothetical protein